MTTPPSTKDVFKEMRDKWPNIPFVMEQEAGKGFAEIFAGKKWKNIRRVWN